MLAEESVSTKRKMHRTKYPGIYRRGSRYVLVYRAFGKQHKRFFVSLAEARRAKEMARGLSTRTPEQRALAHVERARREVERIVGSSQGRVIAAKSLELAAASLRSLA